MDGREYARLFVSLLPPGEAWPHETDEASKFDDLIRALSQEPARVEADGLLVLDSLIPDNENTDLDAWERLVGGPDTELTDEERLARIRGILRASGDVNLESLQAAFELLADDPDIILYNRARPSFEVGLSNVGDAVGDFSAYWLVELYDDLLQEALTGTWATRSGSVAVLVNNELSPVSLTMTADQYTMGAGAEIENAFDVAVADDETVYASVWVKPSTTGTVEFSLADKAGALQTTAFELTGGLWHKLMIEESVGSGGSDLALVLSTPSALVIHVSWGVAGVKDPELEQRMIALTQIHTRGVFGVKTEYATLLAQDNAEVVY